MRRVMCVLRRHCEEAGKVFTSLTSLNFQRFSLEGQLIIRTPRKYVSCLNAWKAASWRRLVLAQQHAIIIAHECKFQPRFFLSATAIPKYV